MDNLLVHFAKWTISHLGRNIYIYMYICYNPGVKLSISRNGQIHISFAVPFMKWTKSCMKVKISFVANLFSPIIMFCI